MHLAYLDPGTGSMLAAAVVAGLSGVAIAIKTMWRRVFRRRPTDSGTNPGQDG